MKKRILCSLLLFSAAVFTSCNTGNHRELNLKEILLGRIWAGDMGFYDDAGELESVLYFGERGFGYDQNHDPETGRPIYDRLDFEWQAYDHGTLVINYIQAPNEQPIAPRELRNVYYDHLALTGDLFIAGEFYRHVTLVMQL